MHENESNNFLEKWPALAEGIIKIAREISKSPSLLKFLADEFSNVKFCYEFTCIRNPFEIPFSHVLLICVGNWDKEIGALLILLHLIPPTAQGKGKGGRCKIDGAKGRIITFHKVRNINFKNCLIDERFSLFINTPDYNRQEPHFSQ